MEDERKRRTEDIGDKEIQRRVAIANRLLDVQKELLATHKEVKVIILLPIVATATCSGGHSEGSII